MFFSNEVFDDFIVDIAAMDDISAEYNGIELSYWTSLLDRKIGYFLSGTRGLYSEFLYDIATITESEQLIDMSKEAINLKEKWEILRILLLRSCIMKTFIKEKGNIINMISDIKGQEKLLINNIKHIKVF